jgi:hypothetical protein
MGWDLTRGGIFGVESTEAFVGLGRPRAKSLKAMRTLHTGQYLSAFSDPQP